MRLIALYLPQYHRIAENDAWWGEGFTEWTNVRRARPLFEGHYQPHEPGELGYYDLRDPAVRQAQVDLARHHGVSAFCYYHYWFAGRRLLERPFAEVLSSGRPDFPFCLCWANEPWSRRWDGREEDVLQAQSYSPEDDVAHIDALLPALADPRAVRVEGKPLFLIYRPSELPDPLATAGRWRHAVERAGLPGLHLVGVEAGRFMGYDARAFGLDATMVFQPNWSALHAAPQLDLGGSRARVYDHGQVWQDLEPTQAVEWRRYPCVFPGWDNTPRRGEDALVMHDSAPEIYEEWLRGAIHRLRSEPPEHQIVFLNAWNEWGEGCHLEPDQRHGRAWLEATARALSSASA